MFTDARSAKANAKANKKPTKKLDYAETAGDWSCFILVTLCCAAVIAGTVAFCLKFPIVAAGIAGLVLLFTIPPKLYCMWKNRER